MQLYVPPDAMLNKDFLRQILLEQKKLLTLAEVKMVEVPKFQELSVQNLYPKFQSKPEMMAYFPDQLPKGRMPDRSYFFNVMNTLYPDYTQQLIQKANSNRVIATPSDDQHEFVHISEEWWQKLNELPQFKCKYILSANSIRT